MLASLFNRLTNLLQDLPNRQLKVLVKDRNVIETTDAERRCQKPEGLQNKIDETVAKFTAGRSFVRFVKLYFNERNNALMLSVPKGEIPND